ncbi:AGE family epimerase/isomerase [Candidatus Latescibacterota bacterium]
MDRRAFLGTAAATTTLGVNVSSTNCAQLKAAATHRRKASSTFSPKSLTSLRDHYRSQLFDEYVPFFLENAADFENGGFMCSLDHDGSLVKSNKFGWFQGRGVWWFSYLYNHFDKNQQYLDIAVKTNDFVLRHFPDKPGSVRWAQDVSKEGDVIKPYSEAHDPFPCYFAIEGMLELARATQDRALRDQALELFKKQVRYVRKPDTPFFGNPPGTQGFNLYMLNLQLATEILKDVNDSEVEKIASDSVGVIMSRFYNPRIKLFNETLTNDLERREGFEDHAYMGHGVEVMWLVCFEAIRTGDQALFDLAASRMLDHLNISYDYICDGFATAIQVDHGDYTWPTVKPAGSMLSFDCVGEYNYMKSLWQLAEAMVGTMIVYEYTGAEWADRFHGLCGSTVDRRSSLRQYGHPLHMLFSDRDFTFLPHTSRKGNYHYPRALMYCIESLERMIER